MAEKGVGFRAEPAHCAYPTAMVARLHRPQLIEQGSCVFAIDGHDPATAQDTGGIARSCRYSHAVRASVQIKRKQQCGVTLPVARHLGREDVEVIVPDMRHRPRNRHKYRHRVVDRVGRVARFLLGGTLLLARLCQCTSGRAASTARMASLMWKDRDQEGDSFGVGPIQMGLPDPPEA